MSLVTQPQRADRFVVLQAGTVRDAPTETSSVQEAISSFAAAAGHHLLHSGQSTFRLPDSSAAHASVQPVLGISRSIASLERSHFERMRATSSLRAAMRTMYSSITAGSTGMGTVPGQLDTAGVNELLRFVSETRAMIDRGLPCSSESSEDGVDINFPDQPSFSLHGTAQMHGTDASTMSWPALLVECTARALQQGDAPVQGLGTRVPAVPTHLRSREFCNR